MAFCKDYGDRPGCLGTPDPKYEMNFDDIGEPPLLWCSHCGPEAHAMNDALTEALASRGPEFASEFERAVAGAEGQQRRGSQ